MPEWIRIRCVNHSQVLDKFTAVLCVVTQRSSPQSRTKRTAVITQATTCALGATMSNILRPKCRFHRKRVAAILCFDLTDEHTQQKIGAFECSPNCDEYRKYSKGLCNNNLKGGGGAGKWVKYGPKLSHFNPPKIIIILRLNLPPPPPLEKSLLPSGLLSHWFPPITPWITGLWVCVVFAWIGRFLIFYSIDLWH